uniref:LIM domain-binding protein 3 n=1 Tax=Schistocephalus solidus TaxID=70667 RepID=A0A0V0J8R5_SCHSO
MNTYLGCVTTDSRRPNTGHTKSPQQSPSACGGRLPTNLDRLASAFSAHSEAADNGASQSNSNQMVEINLKRQSQEKPWGIRIQGGRDYNLQLTVKKTQPGSPAEGVLHCGDEIRCINGEETTNLSHSQASDMIRSSSKDLKLTISKSFDADFSELRSQPTGTTGAPR